jgi:hypothetical protein
VLTAGSVPCALARVHAFRLWRTVVSRQQLVLMQTERGLDFVLAQSASESQSSVVRPRQGRRLAMSHTDEL